MLRDVAVIVRHLATDDGASAVLQTRYRRCVTLQVFCQVLSETVVVVVDEILRVLLETGLRLTLSLALIVAEQVTVLKRKSPSSCAAELS